MKIRTKLQLKDEVDKDLSWRKLELSSMLSSVKIAEGKALQLTLRSSILLLYAHWEGFIKKSSETYLNFVSNQPLKLVELTNSFLALALKQQISEFQSTNKSTIHCQFVEYFKTKLNDNANLNDRNVITAKSNLNSDILKQILTTIGIDYTPFELKSNLIDAQLLNYRNTIAHGEYLLLDKTEYQIIHQEVFSMMVEIKNRIENAVFLDEYKVTVANT